MLSLESLASELIELLVTCGIYYIDYVCGENVENLSSGFYDIIFSDYSFCFSFLHEISFSCFLKSQNSLFTILCDNLVYLLQGAGQDRLGIYIKSVVKGGAADAVRDSVSLLQFYFFCFTYFI